MCSIDIAGPKAGFGSNIHIAWVMQVNVSQSRLLNSIDIQCIGLEVGEEVIVFAEGRCFSVPIANFLLARQGYAIA